MPFSCATGTKPFDCTSERVPACVSFRALRQASKTTKCVALPASFLSLRVISVSCSD